MKRKPTLRLLLPLLAALALAGCSKSSTAPPPPPGGGNTEVEPNDFLPQAVGTLATVPIVVTGAVINGDVDLFVVSSNSSFGLDVSLDWSAAADLELTLSNSAGIFVRHVDTNSHPESCRIGGLPAGNYTVRVGSLSSTAANYTLTIQSF